MENQSGTPDGEGLKKCATTGLYEPPPHKGKNHPSQSATRGCEWAKWKTSHGRWTERGGGPELPT